jgi:hypothetical protein
MMVALAAVLVLLIALLVPGNDAAPNLATTSTGPSTVHNAHPTQQPKSP